MSHDSEDDADNDSTLATGMQILNTYPDSSHPAKVFEDDNLHLRPPTLLLALYQFAPTPEGRRNIEFEIDHAVNEAENTNSKLEELTSYYWHALLIPLRAQGGMTQAPTSHPSRHEDELTSTEIAGIRHRLNRRHLALCRSSFTCPITKFIDESAPFYDPENEDHIGVTLEAAHIIPHALGHSKSSENDEERIRKRRIWDAINVFAGQDIQSLLQGPDIDSIVNIICLEHNCHSAFGKFKLWFEDDPNDESGQWFRLNIVKGKIKRMGTTVIPGTTASGSWLRLVAHDGLPPVSRCLLRIHAALSQVFHASGAGEAIDKILREWHVYKVLAEDGSDANLLASRISMISVY